jgi:oligopeptide transport system ATP-binding protein
MFLATLLSVKNLQVRFHTYAGTVHALRGVDFDLTTGDIVGIVGESGSGKTVTASALMGIIPSPPGEIVSGEAIFNGRDLFTLPETELRKLRGNALSMVFQDPMTALNPVLRIGAQLIEPFTEHQSLTTDEAQGRAIELLRLVGISDPTARLQQYPHQLSGGMRQRIMIAMSLACQPQLLFADEPTTALDVTVQAQILELLKQLNQELNTTIILITHDLGVVAQLCRKVLVMYAGQIVESATVTDLFAAPLHPYTLGLLHAVPHPDSLSKRLFTIEGQPPDLLVPPSGCAFLPRCPFAMQVCHEVPPLFEPTSDHQSRCWLNHPDSPHSLAFAATAGGEV